MIWSLGEHAFSVILALILIDIIISALIIYVYIVLPQGKNLVFVGESFKFNESVYQDVLNQQEKNQRYSAPLQDNNEPPPEAGL